MTTIKEVAEVAGVSFKTVSRVLNNDPNVSPYTRTRVMNAVEQLDYRPNLSARHMRTQRSHTIGFITDQIATTPFAVKIVKGAQDLAWAQNKMLLVLNTEGNPEIEVAAIEMMLERQVEGIIYAATYHRSVSLPDKIREVPTVLLDCYAQDASLPSVVPDETQGGYTATKTLIQKGRYRIGLINMAPQQAATMGRLQGYKEALVNYNIPFDESLVRYGNWRPDGGYENTLALMKLPEPPTALFCANDWTAMGAYEALKELGLRIPQDVAVIGFDNEEMIAAYLRPALSTIALPHYEMGQWAVDYLTKASEQDNLTNPVQHRLACPLVARASI